MDIEHWSGFTDVELNSLRQRGRGRRNARRSRGQPLNQGTRKVIYSTGRAGDDTTKETLPSEAFLSHKSQFSSSDSIPADNKNIDNDAALSDGDSSAAVKLGRADVQKDPISAENSGDSGVALTESPPTSLEEMQKQQKMIEELNKKKKAMLQETIQQRYKQTQQESKTLAVVNQELSKLDNMIFSEINVLREKIEEANRQYNAARKRFERAEKEYVEAKVALHHSTEHKELLAEHLCAVIQENEIRKAKKLEELMVKLNITVGGDENSISSKVLVYQRTPTPRYEHWPQSTSASNSNKRDTLTSSQSLPEYTENGKMVTDAVTKLDVPCSDSTVGSNSSCDPPNSSCDPAGDLHSPSHDPQNCSHDPDNNSYDQSNALSVSSVNNNNKDSINDSKDLNSQANS